MRIPRRALRLPAIAAAATVVAGVGLTGSAAAAGASFGPYHGFAPHDGAWGGYVAKGGPFHSITGSWVEPSVTCNSSNDVYAPWTGVDGYGSQTVEQQGVETNCSNGSPQFRPWYEMFPASPVYWSDPAAAGDNITGTTTDNNGTYTLTLTDNTAGWTETTQQSTQAGDVSAEAVIESPSQSYPSFQELDFSGVTVDGKSFDSINPQAITSGGYGPGPLSGGAFSIKPGAGLGAWSASHAAPSAPGVTVSRYVAKAPLRLDQIKY